MEIDLKDITKMGDRIEELEAENERLHARVEALECVLMEIRQAAEDNNLMPDYIIALTMVAATEQGEIDE